MKILSLNVNGYRAIYNRGDGEGTLLNSLINQCDPDIVLLQEIKCDKDTFIDYSCEIHEYYKLIPCPNHYKTGYSGVAALIKTTTTEFKSREYVATESEYDSGRVVEIETPFAFIIGVYVMNSGSEKEQLRIDWDKKFHQYLLDLRKEKPVIVLGDFNSTRDDKDCYAFEQYFDEYPGCYSFEIDALNNLIKSGFVDSFRYIHKDEIKYSWFSYRGSARYNNQGWRLDYALVDDRLKDKIITSEILGGPCEFSDHSPILLEVNEK